MQVHIQYKNGKPYNISALLAEQGFIQRGAETLPFDVSELEVIPWTKQNPVVGGVGTVNYVLRKLGYGKSRDLITIDLYDFYKRKVWANTLGHFVQFFDKPTFIKPWGDTKKFTGFVCDDIHDKRLGGLDKDLYIFCSEPIEIITEYRAYILQGKIMNVSRYTGPVDYLPDIDLIREIIASSNNRAIAYSIDIGVLKDRTSVLIELNDATSLGNYGLPSMLQAKMIAARWYEITGDMDEAKEQAECYDSPSFISQ